MSYNIRHGRGMDGEIDLARIAKVIADSGADVIGLNEVDVGTRRSGGVDQAATLGDLLHMHVIYGPNILYQDGRYGNAMLSRLPPQQCANVPLPAGDKSSWGLLRVELDWQGTTVHVLTTHLSLAYDESRSQLQRITQVIAGLTGPVALMGDFNRIADTETDPVDLLDPPLRDAWRVAAHSRGQADKGAERGFTFPSDTPNRRIDYVYYAGGFEPVGTDPVRVLNSQASDHLPLLATLGLRTAGSANS